jgi:hypothetical protein
MTLDWLTIAALVRGRPMGPCLEPVGSAEYGVGPCGVPKAVMPFLSQALQEKVKPNGGVWLLNPAPCACF